MESKQYLLEYEGRSMSELKSIGLKINDSVLILKIVSIN